MEKWYSRYRRGDVWWLKLPYENGDGIKDSSVQRKSRPYLIVSCEENNLNSPTFNVVPISTKDSDHLPMHVYFRYQEADNGERNQLILCEQVTTVSIKAFEDSRSYFMYSLNLDLMNKVDEALTRQLGLKPRIADMHVLERIVHEIAEVELAKIEAAKKKDSGMRVEQLAQYLSDTFNLNVDTTALQEGLEYRPEELRYADKKQVQEMRESAKSRKKPAEKKKPAPRKKWSDFDKKRFLEEYESNSARVAAAKFGVTESTAYSLAYQFRKQLKGVKELQKVIHYR